MATNPTMAPPVSARDHGRGAENASLTLVEYGDFECPHCGTAYPIVKELHRRFEDRVRFVFRHFPLTNVHPHAQAAAEASEFAATSGAFWQMHDTLYEQQKRLAGGELLTLAAGLALDGGGPVARAGGTQVLSAREGGLPRWHQQRREGHPGVLHQRAPP
jgi:protein-disulfide isomerase